MSVDNLPISYDFHGDIPFSTPFKQIKPNDIHIYIDLDTNIGKNTCGQNCSHCWFVNYDKVYAKSFSISEGKQITDDLNSHGFHVYPRFVDSFAYAGEFMRLYGPAHNREFRQEQDHKETETMVAGDAWTSGRPLLGDDYIELLDLARDSGYGTISITFHGLIDEDLSLRNRKEYPIAGVFTGQECEQVFERIHAYNRSHDETAEKQGSGFRINIGLTVGRHNNSRESLVRYMHYFNKQGVSTVRFNNFVDHGGRHPELPMEREEIEQFYRDVKWIHENICLNFQLGVSEDFGTYGIKVMDFPGHVGWCRAGRQLFTLIPADTQMLDKSETLHQEKIGDLVACVNVFEPHLGQLVRSTDMRSGEVSYRIDFNEQAIDHFTHERTSGVYKNGCFAKELLTKVNFELTRNAKSALEHKQRKLDIALAKKI